MNQKANKQKLLVLFVSPLWGEEASDGEVIVFWGVEGWSMENMDLSISYTDAVSSKEYLI